MGKIFKAELKKINDLTVKVELLERNKSMSSTKKKPFNNLCYTCGIQSYHDSKYFPLIVEGKKRDTTWKDFKGVPKVDHCKQV